MRCEQRTLRIVAADEFFEPTSGEGLSNVLNIELGIMQYQHAAAAGEFGRFVVTYDSGTTETFSVNPEEGNEKLNIYNQLGCFALVDDNPMVLTY